MENTVISSHLPTQGASISITKEHSALCSLVYVIHCISLCILTLEHPVDGVMAVPLINVHSMMR